MIQYALHMDLVSPKKKPSELLCSEMCITQKVRNNQLFWKKKQKTLSMPTSKKTKTVYPCLIIISSHTIPLQFLFQSDDGKLHNIMSKRSSEHENLAEVFFATFFLLIINIIA